jgi:hypothetical protein
MPKYSANIVTLYPNFGPIPNLTYVEQQGVVYLYNQTQQGNGNWSALTMLTAPPNTNTTIFNFGCGVALSGDGNIVVVAALTKTNSLAFVFERGVGDYSWNQTVQLNGGTGWVVAGTDSFPFVAISGGQ